MIESFEERKLREPQEDENHYGSYVADTLDLDLAKRQTLWRDNYPRQQKLKKEYDPNLVLNRWFPSSLLQM